jgi:hypothetical protein
MDRISYAEIRFYHDVLIPCQSYHDDYVCLRGRVAMSDGDGTTFNTQVPTVRRTWMHVAMFSSIRH